MFVLRSQCGSGALTGVLMVVMVMIWSWCGCGQGGVEAWWWCSCGQGGGGVVVVGVTVGGMTSWSWRGRDEVVVGIHIPPGCQQSAKPRPPTSQETSEGNCLDMFS